jgi:hypothetical protein
MAGTIVANTINTDTAGAVFTTNNAYNGIAKAWVNFSASATPTIGSAFNVTSVTYTTTGIFVVNFTTAMPNATYSFSANAGPASGSAIISSIGLTTSSITLNCYNLSGTNVNFANTCVAVFSS